MKRKVISLLLCSAMTASLGVSASVTAMAADAEPIHISVAGYFFGPVDDEKDVITPAIEARLLEEHGINVDIELVYIEQSNYSELLNTRLAGGTAPDVFLAQSNTTLETYYEQGVIASWDMEFFKENAPDVWEFIQNGAAYGDLIDDVEQWEEFACIDGEMVTVPSFKPDGSMPYRNLIYRGDWLEALGITQEELPTTLDEFVDLMYRFAKEDPDGNGEDDTYGMSVTGLRALFGAYGISSGFVGGTSYWQEEDGTIATPDISDEAKEVIKIVAQMYQDGVIDPEFVTGTEAISGSYWAISNGFVNGKFGVSALASIDHYRLTGVTSEEDAGGACAQEYWAVNGADSEFVYGPWPTGPDGEYGSSVGYSVAVSESAVYNADLMDDPEKLATIFQIMNAFAIDDELYMLAAYGIESEHYTDNGDGTYTRNAEYDNTTFNEIGLWGCRSLYGGDRAFSETAYNAVFYKDKSIANRLEWYAKDQYDCYIQDAVSVTLPSEAELQSEVNTYRDETWIKMIKGELDIEADWDAYVEEYLELGGQTLIDEANEWYASK